MKKILTIIYLFVMLSLNAYAECDTSSESFYGSININGIPASEGVEIHAWINGVQTQGENNPFIILNEGIYGYDAIFSISGNLDYNEQPIIFKAVVDSNVLNCTYIPQYYVCGSNLDIELNLDCQDIGIDFDNDTYSFDDCNDTNPNINPSAIEICNSKDDNCNGEIDELGVCNECVVDLDCPLTDCTINDGCVNGTYNQFSPLTTTSCILGKCIPSTCDDFDYIVTDLDGDGLDVECEKDCNDNLVNACEISTSNGGNNANLENDLNNVNDLTKKSTETNSSKCTSLWNCGNWQECENDLQKRICTDSNNCSIQTNKPIEEQLCEQITTNQNLQSESESEGENEFSLFAEETAPNNLFSRITGAVIGGGGAQIFYVLIFLGLTGGLIAISYNLRK